ncbi:hypothetical protein B0H13DRAFT_2075859 [Mycena leptocephala]|nr:hypothetical protein B0H13DRAFT_2075859 [Mycena leptocephala]
MISSVGFLLLLTFVFLLCNGPSIHVQARVVSRPRRSPNIQRDTTSEDGLALGSASWIWAASTQGPPSTFTGNVAFLKNISTPAGKTASRAIISITAVQHFTIWVNGQPIGASGTGKDDWKSASVLRAALNASVNTFSVLVTNSDKSAATPPGLLAAIQIMYTDSTNSTFLSDSSWLAAYTFIPPKFPMPSDLSTFAPAAVAAVYGSGLWGQKVSLPSPDPSPPTLKDSSWIWSTPNASTNAPVGAVAFRKTFATPSGKSAQSATILLTVDNHFVLYLNGDCVAMPPGVISGDWGYAQQFTVKLNATLNVFTVVGQNFPPTPPSQSPRSDVIPGTSAGFIAAIKILYQDGTSEIIRTDSSWLNSNFISLPVFLSTSDDNLSSSFAQGQMGVGPWHQLKGISDVLSTMNVPNAPFTSSSSASPTSHSVPVAAIVGAVVGGLVIVALLVGLFIWLRRRRNSRAASNEVKAFTTGAPSVAPSTVPPAFTHIQPYPLAVHDPSMNSMPQGEDAEGPPPSYSDAELDGSVRPVAPVDSGARLKAGW